MTLRELLIDFGFPLILIIIATILIASGIDGEMKSILTMSAGWAFRSAVSHRPPKKDS